MTEATSSASLQFKNKVRQSLKRIGFKNVAGGPDFRIGGHLVDACGGWDDILVVAECIPSADVTSIHETISEVRGKQPAIKQGFKKLEGYEIYRRHQFAIVTHDIKYTQDDRDVAACKPRVHLIDFQTIEYYQRLAQLIGQRGAIFNLLGELKIQPQDLDLPKVPAFRVRLAKNLPGYLFWCEPHELLKIAYVARRESGRENYYQRMLTPQRLGNIRKFIQKGGVFPNNVIIAFDDKPKFRPKQAYEDRWPPWLEFGELIFPTSYRSCWIIDGQHRLYAFGTLAPNPPAQKLAVFAFEPMEEHKQANFFIQINQEQKPVSLDLIWDLEGEMSPETPRGRIANCVKELNSMAPLKGKIYLPLSGERKHGQLKMSGVCQDFQDTGLLNDRTRFMIQAQKNPLAYSVNLKDIPHKAATAVADFLEHIKKQSTEALWTNILLRPGGITLALNVYEQIIIRVGQTPTSQHIEKYAKAFVEILNELAPDQSEMRKLVREQLTSYAQRRILSTEMLGKMQEKLGDPEFAKNRVQVAEPFGERLAKFERRLAEFVTERLGILTIAELKQKTPEGVWREAEERIERERKTKPNFAVHEALTLGEIEMIAERRDNSKVLMPLFMDPVNGFGDERAVLAALAGITRVRTAIAHGRRAGNRRLVTAYLETFENVIGT